MKSCTPFIKYVTKIEGTTMDDAGDLDLVMAIYNLLVYNSNDSKTKNSLWFYSKDEAANFNYDIANTNAFKSSEYKDKSIAATHAQLTPSDNNAILKNSTITIPLKYLINFWRSL